MGIRSSKPCAVDGSEAGSCASCSPLRPNGFSRKRKNKGRRVFQSPCLGRNSWYRRPRFVLNNCDRRNANVVAGTSTESDLPGSSMRKIDCLSTMKHEKSCELPCVPSTSSVSSVFGSRSDQATSSNSFTSSRHFRSSRTLIPGNVSFRISKATSINGDHSDSLRMYGQDQGIRTPTRSPNGVIMNNATGKTNVSHVLSQAQTNLRKPCVDSTSDTQFGSRTSQFHDVTRGLSGNSSTITRSQTSRSPSGMDCNGFRYLDQSSRAREPTESNVRFSRTLSVGRLRDRVLRRPSLTTYGPLDQERGDLDSGDHSDGADASQRNALTYSIRLNRQPLSSVNIDGSEDILPRSREASYTNLLERRTHFMERRRRLRSQARALQRAESRMESRSRHERSCILSGRHRTGQCACGTSTVVVDSGGATARTSISRIVLLAEALFEVLDDINQNSVVPSSVSAASAPADVVEALPLKIFRKSKRFQPDEAAQCYICLVEYEEGESMRVLPCHHEFHKSCVDKWLKEIHRICPLCRGNVCSAGFSFVP